MSDEELLQKLEEFAEHLSISNIFTDSIRTIGWLFLKGLAFLVDGLETVTNEILLVKEFFQNPEVVAFVQTMRPFLYILLAFSLLFTGYMMIFQKKIEREAIAINIFIAIIIVGLLGTSMDKANEFTDVAVSTVQTTGGLYSAGDEGGTVSQNILSRNITDLMEFDKNSFSNKDIEPTNTIPMSLISDLKITQKFDKDDLSSNQAQEISKHYIVWTSTGKDVDEFDQGGLEWNNEYYYRYDVNWFTAIVTLLVMGFTLFSIAYKLARLGFELTFNYILAILIAPADVHDGQKTKRVLQSILNTFLVIILIFVSMKVYIFGTTYLANNFDGLPYVIALIGFSVALIDGPNMVERIFGIDAGLKSGWGLLAGAYAGSKALTGTGKFLSNAGKSLSGNNNSNANSPNDSTKGDSQSNNIKNGLMSAMNNGKNAIGDGADNLINKDMENDKKNMEDGKGSDSSINNDKDTPKNGPSLSNGISEQMEQSIQQGKNVKAPSPNDVDRAAINEQLQQTQNSDLSTNNTPSLNQQTIPPNSANNSSLDGSMQQQTQSFEQRSGVQTNANVNQSLYEQMGAQAISQNGGLTGGVTPLNNQQAISSPNSANNGSLDGGMQQQTQSFEQRSGVQTNSEITQTIEQQQGTTNISQSSGVGNSPMQQVAATTNDTGNVPINSNTSFIQGGNTQQTRTSHIQGNGNEVVVNDEIIMNNGSQQVKQGSTTVRETGGATNINTGGGSSFIPSENNSSAVLNGENNVINNTNTTSQSVLNTSIVNNDNINHVQTENQTMLNTNQQEKAMEYSKIRPNKYLMNKAKNFRKK